MTKKRDIGQEILEGVRAIKRGKGRSVAGSKKAWRTTKRTGSHPSKT